MKKKEQVKSEEKSEVIEIKAKDIRRENEKMVNQLEEELKSVQGLREFVNKGADALAQRLLTGQNLYTDNMVELLRKRLTIAWEQSRVLGEYEKEIEATQDMFKRHIAAAMPIEPEVL